MKSKKSKIAKTTCDGRTYKLLTTIPERYDDEGWSVHHPKTGPARKWKKKELYKFQVRMYKTWKHNRKTQWK